MSNDCLLSDLEFAKRLDRVINGPDNISESENMDDSIIFVSEEFSNVKSEQKHEIIEVSINFKFKQEQMMKACDFRIVLIIIYYNLSFISLKEQKTVKMNIFFLNSRLISTSTTHQNGNCAKCSTIYK